MPYRVEKVTMFCYGEKEAWYKRLCPSGMLPALKLDGRLITESDVILAALEAEFGPLHAPFEDPAVRKLRVLERALFSAWCQWLCRPSRDVQQEEAARIAFLQQAARMDRALAETTGPFFLDQFSVADCVFVPYVERMSASLFYYKGFVLRDSEVFPNISAWFSGLEQRQTYLGTQSDFHTHCHDLPPQMGGCYQSGTVEQAACRHRVDGCTDWTVPETGLLEPEDSRSLALQRVVKHREAIMAVNPMSTCRASLDLALRTALTWMVQEGGQEVQEGGQADSLQVPPGTEVGLRYIRY